MIFLLTVAICVPNDESLFGLVKNILKFNEVYRKLVAYLLECAMELPDFGQGHVDDGAHCLDLALFLNKGQK